MIRAVIFDVDNTLIDFIRMKSLTLEAAATAMIDAGLDQPKARIVKEMWALLDKHGYEDSTVFQRYLRKTIGKVDIRILANAVNAYRRIRYGVLEPYPHVISTLIALKERGIQLAILTDAPRLKAWLRLSAMRIDAFFDIVVAHEDTGQLKPAKKPFEVVLKRLGVKPEECLMVGDRVEKDVVGAKRMGMVTAFAKYGNVAVKGKTGADHDLRDIAQILGIVG